ncbi:MAG: hypothetical protein MnENMB40S_34240 [Rhizobiaceae bacterium MnEN-MB40S]|nr:MAG: hypothetical protein MnENMB40S_34240 [Rhizobiaceae bacterium MnEN-MB40S]
MTYNFSALSYADFEDLSRDLIGTEIGVRFESFASGPDGGMDGRHAPGTFKTILQCKHYAGTRWSGLKKTMIRERPSIDRLAAERYILTTSLPLSPKNKAELIQIIGPSLKCESDIFGPGDLNGLLRKYPNIVKSHIKLWLSDTPVLERVLHAAQHNFNDLTKDEILEKVRVYAPNPSFNAAQSILENQHILIISGPPGVGKTTLAEMLCYAHLGEMWGLHPIRNLDDGLIAISDKKKQLFYFDDFLGRVALDKNALSKMDSDLARFIKRVRKAPNARFILTTRAPIFEEAKRHSEHLADTQLNISRYLLDVGLYTRRIRAHILYNHLLVSGAPQTHINFLIDSGKIAEIVDHRNYSPRLIALMTEGDRVSEFSADDYPTSFLTTLTNPTQLWDIPFRKHIPRTCQHLLMTLFFCDEFGVQIEDLRVNYGSYHRALSDHYGASQDPKDFEESLKILEGGFIKIIGTRVHFVNPSVRDYLQAYLNDLTLLIIGAKAAVKSSWAQKVWEHGKRLAKSSNEIMPVEQAMLACAFLPIAQEFINLPVSVKIKGTSGYTQYKSTGLSNSERIELMIEWWYASHDSRLISLIIELARNPVDGWDVYRDGETLIALIGKLRGNGYFDDMPRATDIADILEDGAVNTIEKTWIEPELLEDISDVYEEWENYFSSESEVKEAINANVQREFEGLDETLSEMESESTVDEHLEILQKLGKRSGIPDHMIKSASKMADERKWEIEEESSTAPSLSLKNKDSLTGDDFDDIALQMLFAPLKRE